jgi:pimeloyl-ACP methyl ester carboxylesterase
VSRGVPALDEPPHPEPAARATTATGSGSGSQVQQSHHGEARLQQGHHREPAGHESHHGEAEPSPSIGPGEARPVRVTVDGITLSGLVAHACADTHTHAGTPRGTVLAVHGGGTSAGYFHAAARPDLSLLLLGARLGWTVLALDRPGFGASHGRVEGWSITRRADLYSAAVDAALAEGPRPSGGTLLVAHSLGAHLAAALAPRRPDVIGLEINGSAPDYRPEARPDSPVSHGGRNPTDPAARRRVVRRIWGDRALYPGGRALLPAPVARPDDEPAEAAAWNAAYRDLAGKVEVPVHVTIGEFDGLWPTDRAGLDAVAAVFGAAPWAGADVQRGAPHNTSLSLAARAYHLRVLAFAEDCLGWAQRSGRGQ